MRTIKNLLATVVLVIGIALFFGAVRLLALIPIAELLSLLKSNWIGLLIGIGISHLAMAFATFWGRRRQGEGDDE